MFLYTIIYVSLAVHAFAADTEPKSSSYYSEYYGDYYDSEYDDMQPKASLPIETTEDTQVDEDNVEADATVEPPTILVTTTEVPQREFRGQVLCSNTLMTLEIDKTLLPSGLGFSDSLSEESETRGDFGPISCIRITHNNTHYIYKVALQCQRAVGKLDYVLSTIYTHEFVLDNIKQKKSKRKTSQSYSIIIDCETPIQKSTPQKWIPQYRIFEHREGRDCSVETCPHGDLCLPSTNIKGYFCSCPKLEGGCECPADFYGCSLGDGVTSHENVICVRNDQLCDTRYDCPLQDDETCGEEWESWSPWSPCSASCGEGTQLRQRSCAYVFTEDSSRSNKECSNSSEIERDVQTCNPKSCSSVNCGSQEMTIEIPLEFGMTPESVKERMRLSKGRDEEECMPNVNTTHVTFVIPLHKCGTDNWVDGDIVFYSNVVEYGSVNQESSIIVRELGHSYTAKCQYKRRHTVSMERIGSDTNFHEIASLKFEDTSTGLDRDAERLDVITHYSSGDGEFEYKMDIFQDSSYSTFYEKDDYPLKKKLGERLYIGVNFKSQDEDLHVFIERCWATSSDESGSSYDDAIYLFINGGCAIDKTVQFHNDDASPFSDRYSIETFKFNDAQFWYIYFRCDVILCDASENDPACQRQCQSGASGNSNRRRRSANMKKHTHRRVMQGPVVVLQEDDVTGSMGTVEHKVITTKDIRVRQSDLQSPKSNLWESPYIAAGIVGSICLAIGIVMGLKLRRRNPPTRSNETHL